MQIIIPFVLLVIVAALLWPQRRYLFARAGGLFLPSPTLGEPTVESRSVKWYDDYFTIEYIDSQTIAIGEPRYHQHNYNYLIIGEERAVLFDTGSGVRDIKPVVESLTMLPVIVSQSHLHYDHIGNHDKFDGTALPELPHLRRRLQSGTFQVSVKEHLGFVEGIEAPKLTVSEWWTPDSSIDLGGRTLTVLHIPGHTPNCIALFDREHAYLFTGDFLCPGLNVAGGIPGSNINEYLNSARRLLGLLPPETRLLTAHRDKASEPFGAPMLKYTDLVDLARGLGGIIDGTLKGKGFYIKSYLINERIQLYCVNK
ncbi:MAG: MBL fold metallo-hydrolase [Xenococcaceae cyanobacterium MO_167.B52]|nr:MBL fold metallo-hydrolase [Xenococcaceae cyanobacterium MO_167.B52]